MYIVLSILGIIIVCIIIHHQRKFSYNEGLKVGVEVGLGLAKGENYEDLMRKYGGIK